MLYEQRLAALMHEPSTNSGDDPNRLRRVEVSRTEMLAQGAAIRATLEAEDDRVGATAAAIAGRGLRRVVIIGCGDSYGIGIACRLAFETLLGVPTEAVQALDYALYASRVADPETLVIGISASGGTEAVLAGLRAAKERGAFTLGVSNTAGSPLMTEFSGGLAVRATRKGWPTQSTTATIALLDLLAVRLSEHLGRGEASRARLSAAIAKLPERVDQVTAAFDEPARALAERFAAAPLIMFAGAGPHLGTAFFGSSKIKELGPIHAFHFPIEEFHHYRAQKAGDLLFIVAPDPESHARALDTAMVGRAVGGHTVALLPEGETEIAALVDHALLLPDIPAELAPILYSVPLHLFAYHFAKARFARNLGYPPPASATA